MSFTIDLTGKTALVTGASLGLGRHFARTLAAQGAAVVLAARQKDKLDALVAELTAKGQKAAAVTLDLTDGESVKKAAVAANQFFGPLDILVNNAGIAIPKPVLEQTDDDWNQVIDTNLNGAFFMAREVARGWAAAKRPGNIINIASVHGLGVIGQLPSYMAAKAAMIHLTKSLGLDLARHNIRVNAIAPGYIETDMNREFFATEPGLKMIRNIPMRRLGKETDLDGILLLLASDASAYATGGTFVVDGGFLLS